MPKVKTPKPTRTVLQREIRELKAQLAFTYHYAAREVWKTIQSDMLGSGVIVSMQALGGRELLRPVCIRDGLSRDTIVALVKDIERSYTEATTLKP